MTAAAALVAAHGPGAVSHRTVAAAAAVPLAATTYYFHSLDELLTAAVERVADAELTDATALVQALPRRRRSGHETAGVLLDVVLGSSRTTDADLLGYYERMLAVGRHPALRPVLQRARQRMDDLVTEALDRCGHRAPDLARLIAVLDGTALSALVEGDGEARPHVLAAVAHLLTA